MMADQAYLTTVSKFVATCLSLDILYTENYRDVYAASPAIGLTHITRRAECPEHTDETPDAVYFGLTSRKSDGLMQRAVSGPSS